MNESDCRSLLSESGVALLHYLESGGTLGAARGHSLQTQEALYHVGHTYYNQAKYEEAMRVFVYLASIHHTDRRYHLGYAACLQVLKRYQEAIKYYAIASMLDLTDPVPPMHTAECYLALGDRAQAKASLQYALLQANTEEPHRGLVPRLEAMLEFLETDPRAGSNNVAAVSVPAATKPD